MESPLKKEKKPAAPQDKPVKVSAEPNEEPAKEQAAEEKQEKETKTAPKRVPLAGGTYFAKWNELTPKWRLVDATNQTLGRLGSYLAGALMGKDKPTYTRSSDTGDCVVVIHAEKVRLTGSKLTDKLYQYHTNYPGGIKTFTAKEILRRHPERLIEKAVLRMLPKGHMGRRWFKKLKVYAGSEHPHSAQKPEPVKLPNLGIR